MRAKDNMGREVGVATAIEKKVDELSAKGYKFKIHAWANNFDEKGRQMYHVAVTAPFVMTLDGDLDECLDKVLGG